MGQDNSAQDKRIDDIYQIVQTMNNRGLDNAEKQGIALGTMQAMEKKLDRIADMAHEPKNCPTTAQQDLKIAEARNESEKALLAAEVATKKADNAVRKVENLRAGKGMTGREKLAFGSLMTGMIAVAEAIARLFGK